MKRSAVCPGRVGLGVDVAQAQAFAEPAEGAGSVARAVVGDDPFDGDAEAFVVGDGGLEEGNGASLALSLHDPGEGDARGVVDGDVDELPADATTVALAGPVAGDAMA
jgi:hypothetical protein